MFTYKFFIRLIKLKIYLNILTNVKIKTLRVLKHPITYGSNYLLITLKARKIIILYKLIILKNIVIKFDKH